LFWLHNDQGSEEKGKRRLSFIYFYSHFFRLANLVFKSLATLARAICVFYKMACEDAAISQQPMGIDQRGEAMRSEVSFGLEFFFGVRLTSGLRRVA